MYWRASTLKITPTEGNTMTVYYEWDVEEVADADQTVEGQDFAKDDIMEHWHQKSYADCLTFIQQNPPADNVRYDIVLIRDDDDRRAWAYMEDGNLPEWFCDANGEEYKKVPQEYIKEVAKTLK
jgi:hypothetical protein